LPQARGEPVAGLWGDVYDPAPARGGRAAPALGGRVGGGEGGLRVLGGEQGGGLPQRRAARRELGPPGAWGGVVVGVGHVRRGGDEQRDPVLGPCPGAHIERDVVLVVAGAQPRGVDPARQVVRRGEREVDVPAGVLQVVVVEVDRAVLLRGVDEV